MSAPAPQDDFVTAVLVALNPDRTNNNDIRLQAQRYIEQIKQSPQSWKLYLDRIQPLTVTRGPVEVLFFCLQQLTEAVKAHYDEWPSEQRVFLCSSLMIYIRDTLPAHSVSSFLKNKLAELMVAVLTVDYVNTWPTFFNDFINMLNHREIVDVFVRILLTIDAEIVIHDARRTNSQVARCLAIKDAMRVRDMPRIIETLFGILGAYSAGPGADVKLTNKTLNTLREYIGWIDISLVANERCVTVLYSFITAPSPYRREACHCMQEILEKKMDKDKKAALVIQFRVVEMLGTISIDTNDSDKCSDFAALILSVGQQLLDCVPPHQPILTPTLLGQCYTEIERVMSIAYRYFDRCTSAVLHNSEMIDLLKSYVRIMSVTHSTDASVIDNHIAHTRRMYGIINERMNFPSDFPFDNIDEDEETFLEFRSQLHNLFCCLVPCMPDMCVELTAATCTNVLGQWQSQSFGRIEASLRLLYDLGEALKGGLAQRLLTDPLKSLIYNVLSSEVRSHPHHQIALIYFNLVFRYVRFLDTHPQLLPTILLTFLDQRGLQHQHPKVRGRACYLLYKVLSTINEVLKKQIRPFVDAMLGPIQSVIENVLFNANTNNTAPTVAVEDAQYLCESLGILVSSNVTMDACVQYVTLVLSFFHTHLTNAIGQSPSFVGNSDREEAAGIRLALMLDAFGNFSKALNKDSLRVRELFDTVFNDSCTVFTLLPRHENVRQSLIFVVHRMIECRGELLVTGNQLPVILPPLISESNEKNLPLLLPLLTQLITQFKGKFAPTLHPHFLPLCQRVKQCLDTYSHTTNTVKLTAQTIPGTVDSESIAYSTDRQERILLEQRFFAFLRILLQELPDVFLDPSRSPPVWPIIDMLVAGIRSADTGIARTCLICLQLLLRQMQSLGLLTQPTIQQWIVSDVITVSLQSVLATSFNLDDANTVAMLRELITLDRLLLTLYDSELVTVISNIDSLGQRFAQSFVSAIQANDWKQVRETIKSHRDINKQTHAVVPLAVNGEYTDDSKSQSVFRTHVQPHSPGQNSASRASSNSISQGFLTSNGPGISRSSSPGFHLT